MSYINKIFILTIFCVCQISSSCYASIDFQNIYLAPKSSLNVIGLNLNQLSQKNTQIVNLLKDLNHPTLDEIHQTIQNKIGVTTKENVNAWIQEAICDSLLVRIFKTDSEGKSYELFYPLSQVVYNTKGYSWGWLPIEEIKGKLTSLDSDIGGRLGAVLSQDLNFDNLGHVVESSHPLYDLITNTNPANINRARILHFFRASILDNVSNSDGEGLKTAEKEYQTIIKIMNYLQDQIKTKTTLKVDADIVSEMYRSFKIAYYMSEKQASPVSIITTMCQYSLIREDPEIINILKQMFGEKQYDEILFFNKQMRRVVTEKYYPKYFVKNINKKGYSFQNFIHMLTKASVFQDGSINTDILKSAVITTWQEVIDSESIKGEKMQAMVEDLLIPHAESLGLNDIADDCRDVVFKRNHNDNGEYSVLLQAISEIFGMEYNTLVNPMKRQIEPRLQEALNEKFPSYDIEIHSRIKSLYSIRKKIITTFKKQNPGKTEKDLNFLDVEEIKKYLTEIYDLFGFQIVFHNEKFIRGGDPLHVKKVQKNIIYAIQDEFVSGLSQEQKESNIFQKTLEQNGYREMKTKLVLNLAEGSAIMSEFQVMTSFDYAKYKYGADKKFGAVAHFEYKLRTKGHLFDVDILLKLTHKFNGNFDHDLQVLCEELDKYEIVKVVHQDPDTKKNYIHYVRISKGEIIPDIASSRTLNPEGIPFKDFQFVTTSVDENGDLIYANAESTKRADISHTAVSWEVLKFNFVDKDQKDREKIDIDQVHSYIIKHSKRIRTKIISIRDRYPDVFSKNRKFQAKKMLRWSIFNYLANKSEAVRDSIEEYFKDQFDETIYKAVKEADKIIKNNDEQAMKILSSIKENNMSKVRKVFTFLKAPKNQQISQQQRIAKAAMSLSSDIYDKKGQVQLDFFQRFSEKIYLSNFDEFLEMTSYLNYYEKQGKSEFFQSIVKVFFEISCGVEKTDQQISAYIDGLKKEGKDTAVDILIQIMFASSIGRYKIMDVLNTHCREGFYVTDDDFEYFLSELIKQKDLTSQEYLLNQVGLDMIGITQQEVNSILDYNLIIKVLGDKFTLPIADQLLDQAA